MLPAKALGEGPSCLLETVTCCHLACGSIIQSLPLQSHGLPLSESQMSLCFSLIRIFCFTREGTHAHLVTLSALHILGP